MPYKDGAKITRYTLKYAKIRILMVSSVLCITSQVEHTKECNSIDSESKSVKQNADNQNPSTMCFYMLLSYSKKTFWLEQNALARSTD